MFVLLSPLTAQRVVCARTALLSCIPVVGLKDSAGERVRVGVGVGVRVRAIGCVGCGCVVERLEIQSTHCDPAHPHTTPLTDTPTPTLIPRIHCNLSSHGMV